MDIKSGFACKKSMMIENESNRSLVGKWRWTMNPLAVRVFPSFSNLNIAHVPHRKRQLSTESSWTPVSETLACGTSFLFSPARGKWPCEISTPQQLHFILIRGAARHCLSGPTISIELLSERLSQTHLGGRNLRSLQQDRKLPKSQFRHHQLFDVGAWAHADFALEIMICSLMRAFDCRCHAVQSALANWCSDPK
jgi:hypothetical protein